MKVPRSHPWRRYFNEHEREARRKEEKRKLEERMRKEGLLTRILPKAMRPWA